MTFESEGLLIVAIYIWLLLASYVVFLTTLVSTYIRYFYRLSSTAKIAQYIACMPPGQAYTV